MAQDLSLTDLPVGSTAKLKVRLVSDDGTIMTIDFLQDDGTIHGSAEVTKATGAMTGQLTVALADTLVEPVAINLSVGDVVRNTSTGEVHVVQTTGLGPDGAHWSSSTAGQPTYAAEGWVVVDTVDLS